MIALLTTFAVVTHALIGCCAHEWQPPAKTQAIGCCEHDHATPTEVPPEKDDHDCSHVTCVWLATDEAPEIAPLYSSSFLLSDDGMASSGSATFSAEFSRWFTVGVSNWPPVRLHLVHGVLLI